MFDRWHCKTIWRIEESCLRRVDRGRKIAKESHGDERYEINEKSGIYLAYQNAHIQGLESLLDCLGCQWVLGFLRMLGRPEPAPQACIL